MGSEAVTHSVSTVISTPCGLELHRCDSPTRTTTPIGAVPHIDPREPVHPRQIIHRHLRMTSVPPHHQPARHMQQPGDRNPTSGDPTVRTPRSATAPPRTHRDHPRRTAARNSSALNRQYRHPSRYTTTLSSRCTRGFNRAVINLSCPVANNHSENRSNLLFDRPYRFAYPARRPRNSTITNNDRTIETDDEHHPRTRASRPTRSPIGCGWFPSGVRRLGSFVLVGGGLGRG